MKELHELVNIIPVIAKADTLTPNELRSLKQKVSDQSWWQSSPGTVLIADDALSFAWERQSQDRIRCRWTLDVKNITIV